jgi:hypothetical protein
LFQTVPVGGNGGADVAEIRKVVFTLAVVVVVLEVEGDDVVGGGGRRVVNLEKIKLYISLKHFNEYYTQAVPRYA